MSDDGIKRIEFKKFAVCGLSIFKFFELYLNLDLTRIEKLLIMDSI